MLSLGVRIGSWLDRGMVIALYEGVWGELGVDFTCCLGGVDDLGEGAGLDGATPST